jgi:hypothetical protein
LAAKKKPKIDVRNLATLSVMGVLLEALFAWLMPPWFGRRKRRR